MLVGTPVGDRRGRISRTVGGCHPIMVAHERVDLIGLGQTLLVFGAALGGVGFVLGDVALSPARFDLRAGGLGFGTLGVGSRRGGICASARGFGVALLRRDLGFPRLLADLLSTAMLRFAMGGRPPAGDEADDDPRDDEHHDDSDDDPDESSCVHPLTEPCPLIVRKALVNRAALR